ncbi:MAG: hypothetical protein LBU61_01060 [Coriobacteriales bacterium]|jgi:predicted  nucleic acid-binding Zn-ribbon protein|nr:hypothetical protein [Coriobacteriales bacterium]
MSPASQGETLLKLVDVDKLLLQLDKQLNALPQRPKLDDLADTFDQLADKSEQVAKLRLRQEMSIKALRDERQLLSEKVIESQRQIEANSTKYKEVSLLSTEIENLNKRIEKITYDIGELNAGIGKINAVEKQLSDRQAYIHARQTELTESLENDISQLEAQSNKLEQQRQKLTALLPAELVKRYDRQRGLKQGIGAAALEGHICQACHIELTEGQLARAKRDADEAGVGTCPSCLRLLVI